MASCPACAALAFTLRRVDETDRLFGTPPLPKGLLNKILPSGTSARDVVNVLEESGLLGEAFPWRAVAAKEERIARLEASRAALKRLVAEFKEEAGLNRSIADAMGGVLTRDYEDTDFAQRMGDREVNDRLVQRLSDNREQVEHALSRLAEGKYGECVVCGCRIPPERLRFYPEATRCVDCQDRLDRLNQRTA